LKDMSIFLADLGSRLHGKGIYPLVQTFAADNGGAEGAARTSEEVRDAKLTSLARRSLKRRERLSATAAKALLAEELEELDTGQRTEGGRAEGLEGIRAEGEGRGQWAEGRAEGIGAEGQRERAVGSGQRAGQRADRGQAGQDHGQ
jgi:hypothetical protein